MTTYVLAIRIIAAVNTLKSALFDGDSDLPVIITYLAWENFASCSVRGTHREKIQEAEDSGVFNNWVELTEL
jgi:hypothetical protein